MDVVLNACSSKECPAVTVSTIQARTLTNHTKVSHSFRHQYPGDNIFLSVADIINPLRECNGQPRHVNYIPDKFCVISFLVLPFLANNITCAAVLTKAESSKQYFILT